MEVFFFFFLPDHMQKAFLEDGGTWKTMTDVVVDIDDESRKSEN